MQMSIILVTDMEINTRKTITIIQMKYVVQVYLKSKIQFMLLSETFIIRVQEKMLRQSVKV